MPYVKAENKKDTTYTILFTIDFRKLTLYNKPLVSQLLL